MQRQLTWAEGVEHSFARERESEGVFTDADDEPERHYWTKDDVERLHCEVGQRIIRAIPERDAEMLGPLALKRIDMQDGDLVTEKIVRILSVVMQGANGTPFLPGEGPVSPAAWVQMGPLSQANKLAFTFFGNGTGGRICFAKGYKVRLLALVEPVLADFQSNAVLIPAAGYFEFACGWVHQQLTVANHLPAGQA